MIPFPSEQGQVAADGIARARVSAFAAGLPKHMGTPELEIEILMKRVTTEVRAATNVVQQPDRLSKLQTEFYFRQGQLVADRPMQAITTPLTVDKGAEAVTAWERIRTSKDPEAIEASPQQFGSANTFYSHLVPVIWQTSD